jgi:predicted transcriptional regulator of viral defense system
MRTMMLRARDWVDDLLARGRHTFTREEAEAALGTSSPAAYLALRRLAQHGSLAMPRRGFYLIVEPAHRAFGAPPPMSWIDDLMRFSVTPYYVGLLSAAALLGAADQSPQEFQVVSGRVLRPVVVGRVRIRFFYRRHMSVAVTGNVKSSSGYVPVSTPEMTAFDLVRYRMGAGSMEHVATVIAALSERLDARRLLAIARRSQELPVIQRLGYLLDLTGGGRLTTGLARFVEGHEPRVVRLEPGSTEMAGATDSKWGVLVNTTIETEA